MKLLTWCFVWLLAGAGAVSAQPDLLPVLSEPAPVQSLQVPAAVIALPRGEHAILVEKQTQRFYIYGSVPGFRGLVRVFDTPCSTGEAFGPKQVEGDKKTPEGIYFIINEHLEKDLTPIYGPRAFPLDYPHLLDRHQGKTGYAIWIHGTNKPLKPMDTNGCVALENPDVLRLSAFVTRHVTPVIIQETIRYTDPETLVKQEAGVTRFLAGWIRAHLTGTYQEYAALYLPGSLPDVSTWEAWGHHLRRAEDAGNPFRIQISRKGIYRQGDMFVVAMDFELIQARTHHLLGRRRLFVHQPAGSKTLQIAGDEFQDAGRPRPALAVMAAGAERLLGSR